MSKRIILAGPAAAGKDYIRNKFKNKGFQIDCSYTTRPIREGEKNGREYNFVSEEVFLAMIANKEFFEYVKHGEYYYGTELFSWENADVFIMETDGLKQLSKDEADESLIIYVTAPRSVRIKRMKEDRGWDNHKIFERLKVDIDKFRGFEKIADLVINSTEQNIEL